MERIQESRLTILERWHSPYERRSELAFGSMENPVQHVGRHRRFAYQSHRKKVNRGWLIERGIVAFHWSIFPRAKWNVLWETPKSFRVDLEVFPKKKTRQKPGEKKGVENYLPYTYVTSYKVTSGDFR